MPEDISASCCWWLQRGGAEMTEKCCACFSAPRLTHLTAPSASLPSRIPQPRSGLGGRGQELSLPAGSSDGSHTQSAGPDHESDPSCTPLEEGSLGVLHTASLGRLLHGTRCLGWSGASVLRVLPAGVLQEWGCVRAGAVQEGQTELGGGLRAREQGNWEHRSQTRGEREVGMGKNPHFQGKIRQGREEAMENERRRRGNGQGKIKATTAAGSGDLVCSCPRFASP